MIGKKRSESGLQNYETGGPTPDANRRATGGKGVSSAPGRKKKRTFLRTSGQLAVLLLVTVLTQAFLTLVCCHLVTLSFLATGHIASR